MASNLVRRLPIPALFCALAVLLCELASRPYAEMGICDDWSYIRTAQILAGTGHVVYNGWAAPILGWQLYLGAAFIRLFGFSFTAVRMSTLLVAVVLAFVLQRTLVLAGINERNATIGTLALALSPLYLELSVTFMTDIQGLFAMVLCLYGCLRALRATTPRAVIGWLCFAVVANAICGTSRQVAWLGVLVMVPSALWLLRAQRRVLFAGAAATLAGVTFIAACMHWFQKQPYAVPEQLFPAGFSVFWMLWQLVLTCLDIPFLMLGIMALFLPEIRKCSRRTIVVVVTACLAYALLAFHPRPFPPICRLEPALGDWVTRHGFGVDPTLKGTPPIFLRDWVWALLTFVSAGSLLCVIASLSRSRRSPHATESSPGASWDQLGFLLVPCTIAYILLLVPRAATKAIFDRYVLWLLVVVLLCLVRYYQERIQPQLPRSSILLVATVAIYGVAVTHNMFAFYRARVALAAELRAAGVPDTSVDNGWEYNMWVELQYSDFVNQSSIVAPAHVNVPMAPAGACSLDVFGNHPHVKPRYSVAFDPNECYGQASFAPVNYSSWATSKPGTLYIVRYTPPPRP